MDRERTHGGFSGRNGTRVRNGLYVNDISSARGVGNGNTSSLAWQIELLHASHVHFEIICIKKHTSSV